MMRCCELITKVILAIFITVYLENEYYKRSCELITKVILAIFITVYAVRQY